MFMFYHAIGFLIENDICRYGAAGCGGGTDNAAYEWMMDYGLPTEEEYGTYKNKVNITITLIFGEL